MNNLIFKDLYIFEMANNHSGSILSAKKIIDQCAIVAKRFSIKGAVKLQYRNLKNYISKKNSGDNIV